jgi:hypothetical protein
VHLNTSLGVVIPFFTLIHPSSRNNLNPLGRPASTISVMGARDMIFARISSFIVINS